MFGASCTHSNAGPYLGIWSTSRPHQALVLSGEQGSTKSTFSAILRETAYRVKAEGRIRGDKSGKLIRELIRDASRPSKNRSRSAHPGMLVPEHEMTPAEAEGRLVDADVVRYRIAAAGVELRRGLENLRRSVEAVCCPECRDAVVDAVSAAAGDVARQIGKALAG